MRRIHTLFPWAPERVCERGGAGMQKVNSLEQALLWVGKAKERVAGYLRPDHSLLWITELGARHECGARMKRGNKDSESIHQRSFFFFPHSTEFFSN